MMLSVMLLICSVAGVNNHCFWSQCRNCLLQSLLFLSYANYKLLIFYQYLIHRLSLLYTVVQTNELKSICNMDLFTPTFRSFIPCIWLTIGGLHHAMLTKKRLTGKITSFGSLFIPYHSVSCLQSGCQAKLHHGQQYKVEGGVQQ